MIAQIRQLMEMAYINGKYRLAASIAMLSECGWCANDLNDKERAIVEQAERLVLQPNLTSKGMKRSGRNEPKPPNDVGSEVQPQPTAKAQPKAEPKRFVKPTVEEVAAYCRQRNNNVNAQQFVDFYEAKGWLIGPNRMKDWKAAVRTWEQRDRHDRRDRRGATPAQQEQLNLSF